MGDFLLLSYFVLQNKLRTELRNFAILCKIIYGVKKRACDIGPITINGMRIVQVVIDPHYEDKHFGSMTDELILKLVLELDGRRQLPDQKTIRYSYFATSIEFESRQYRLVWLLEDDAIYIGIVNAYRDRRRL